MELSPPTPLLNWARILAGGLPIDHQTDAMLQRRIEVVLRPGEQLKAAEIVRKLGARGIEIDRRVLNKHLYASRHLYQFDSSRGAPRWRLLAEDARARSTGQPSEVDEDHVVGANGASQLLGTIRDEIRATSPRNLAIFVHRRLEGRPTTLESLGRRFGVTRERVRQLEHKVVQRLERLRARETNLPRGIKSVHEALPSEIRTHGVVEALLAGTLGSEESIVAATLLWLRGETVRAGFVFTPEAQARLENDLAVMSGRSAPSVGLLRRRVEQHIPEITSPQLAVLLASFQPALAGSSPRQTNAERVVEAFEQTRTPLSKAEVAVATGLTERQTGAVLGRKTLFQWVMRGRYAPVSWGLPTYSGTEQALTDELKLMGGEASRQELIQRVVDRYDSNPASASMYLAASPQFACFAGRVILIDPGGREFSAGYPSRQRRVYSDLRGGLVWGIDVDDDLLRGSGRSVPMAVAAALGSDPARPVTLEMPGAVVTVQRAGTVMAISSLRRVAETVGGRLGDRLLLRIPQGGAWTLDIARANVAGLASALAYVGHTAGDSADRSLVVSACWEEDPSLLLETLWDRREGRLLALLAAPESDPRGQMLDLRRLDQMVGGMISRRKLSEASGIGSQGLAADGGIGIARLTSRQSTLLCRKVAELLAESAAVVEERLFGTRS